jgi:hypothetical protein
LRIDFHYEEGRDGRHIPSVRHVQLENVTCDQCMRIAEIHGFDNAVIASVGLRNSEFANVAKPSIIENSSALILENIVVNGQKVIAV